MGDVETVNATVSQQGSCSQRKTEENKVLHAAQALSLNLTNNPIWRRIIKVSMRFSTRSDIYGGR